MASILDNTFTSTKSQAIKDRIHRQLARTLCSLNPVDVVKYGFNMLNPFSSGKNNPIARVSFMLSEMESGCETRDDCAAEIRGQWNHLSAGDWSISQWNKIQELHLHKFPEELVQEAVNTSISSKEIEELREQNRLLKENNELKTKQLQLIAAQHAAMQKMQPPARLAS